jgi:hypothetical protein
MLLKPGWRVAKLPFELVGKAGMIMIAELVGDGANGFLVFQQQFFGLPEFQLHMIVIGRHLKEVFKPHFQFELIDLSFTA